MSPHELKREHERRNPGSHYFDIETLNFFGEKMSSMKVLARTCAKEDSDSKLHDCYVLSSYQSNAPGINKWHYAYFDIDTFENII